MFNFNNKETRTDAKKYFINIVQEKFICSNHNSVPISAKSNILEGNNLFHYRYFPRYRYFRYLRFFHSHFKC